jgi:histidinol dehydrogenase
MKLARLQIRSLLNTWNYRSINLTFWRIKSAMPVLFFSAVMLAKRLGDYCAGPNHVLPTSRTARFSSPLGVYDFQKRSSLIQVSQQGAAKLGAIASVLAHGEGLQAHALSAEYRFKNK